MNEKDVTVYVVDDDESVRKATARMLRAAGIQVLTFPSAREFLDQRRATRPGCLILDLEMPGLSGIELQQELKSHHMDLPIVFMTGHGDISTSVQAMKEGAVDFLPKPVDNDVLLETVRKAIRQYLETLQTREEVNTFLQRVDCLTKREHEVMLLVVKGLPNKRIARQLGITETTVKVHRGRVMGKTGVDSVATLVLLCERAGMNA